LSIITGAGDFVKGWLQIFSNYCTHLNNSGTAA